MWNQLQLKKLKTLLRSVHKPFKFKSTEGKFKLQNNEKEIEEQKRLARERLEMLNKEIEEPKVVEEKKQDVVIEKNDKAKIGADRFKPKAKTEQPPTEHQVITQPTVQETKQQPAKEETPVKPVKKVSVSENSSKPIKKKLKKTTTNSSTVATKNVMAKWDDWW